jgi:phage-related protein
LAFATFGEKKSARGIATPKAEIALIKQRLKEAYVHYEQEIGDSNE